MVSCPLSQKFIYSPILYSFVDSVLGITKSVAQVPLDKHATFAGSKRGVVAMVVSACWSIPMHYKINKCHVIPKSPSQSRGCWQPATKKCKEYCTNTVGTINMIDTDFYFASPVGKSTKTTSSSSTPVQFESIIILKATRKSTCSTKDDSRQDINKLFRWLRQEFSVVAKTCEEISQVVE